MEIAREWLHTCETSHLECLGTSVPELPTRVIEIGVQEDWTDLRITHARKKRAAYITLSHCWGGPVAPMLTSRTIHIFQDQLPFLELPANFRDAICITRRLGFRYLWIDSLCIIQDSREDWAEESQRMGLVYRNSAVTISAIASKGASQGIISRDVQVEPDLPPPATVRLSKGSDDTITVLRQNFDEETLGRLDARSPLSSRGWCLQESILSPRHMYYGRSQIYWRCPTGYQAADGTSSGLRVPEFTFPHMSAVIYRDIRRSQTDTNPVERLLLQDYYTLVENYSQRRLTFSSDKLPAFSGISERLHPIIGGRYIAGLWTKDLAAGLLWQREMATCKHVEPYRAPSWSWAVTDESIVFDKKDALPESSIAIRLVDVSVHLKDETNLYGEITAASITLEGLTFPLIRSRQHIQIPTQLNGFGHLSFDEDPPRYEDDDPDIPSLIERTRLRLFLPEDVDSAFLLAISGNLSGSATALGIDYSFNTAEEYLAIIVCIDEPDVGWAEPVKWVRGLVIKPVYGREEGRGIVYERVGSFTFESFKVSRLGAWENRTVKLI